MANKRSSDRKTATKRGLTKAKTDAEKRCRFMPTVEACQSAAASLITERCFRDCV